MIPVDQTRFGNEGNCLAACFASILELPIFAIDFSCADVPEDGWFDLALSKLKPLGYRYIDVKVWKDADGRLCMAIPDGTVFIATGPTSRSDLLHSVVGQMVGNHWQMLHDPNPSRAGLTELTHVGFLVLIGGIP